MTSAKRGKMKTKRISFDPEKIFHKTQFEVWNNFLYGGTNVIAAGRRWGKSYFSVYFIFIQAMTHSNSNYFWVAPSVKMFTAPWNDIVKICKRSLGDSAKVGVNEKVISLPNGSKIYFRSSDDPQSLRSQGLRGVVMDECSKTDEKAWTQGIKPSLTDYDDSWAILIGTPYGVNWFSRLWDDGNLGKNRTRSFHFTSYDNPKISHALIDLDKLTMSDKEFRQEHLAEFVTDSGFVFDRKYFKHEQKQECYARYLSFDTASTTGAQSAFSAVTVGELRYDKKLQIVEVAQEKVEFPDLEYFIERMVKKYNADGKLDGIIIESASSGIALLQTLYATSSPEISELLIPFNPRIAKRQRAQSASKWIEKGCVIFPLYSLDKEWLVDFEQQLITFTGADEQLKDMVDTFSQLCLCLQSPLSEGLLYSETSRR